MALVLTEQDVTVLLDIETAIAAVEEVLRDQATGQATNRPRYRVGAPASQLAVMAAGDRRLGIYGLKTYTASRKGARFLVLLYESDTGDLLAILEADRLGQMRTGAASGVATRYMAREPADVLGVYGSGWQAESQILAVCAVRKIRQVRVHSRNAEKRDAFARRMASLVRSEVVAVESPEQAARGCSIIVTATGSREPVLKGEWIDPGTHINAVGSNFLSKAEIDVETVRRAAVIAVDSIEQSRLEAGDLLPAVDRGVITWESVTELGHIIAGHRKGREKEDDVTLFKSNGVALEDISTALRIYNLARERGVGRTLELWR
jgi:ornithine cyclodeaminase/alanine dehydrogenase-like protein (mu-crystallin family)